MRKIFLITILALTTTSCAAAPPSYRPDPTSLPSQSCPLAGGAICRVVDHEAGVVCWVSDQGLSCLPTNDTFLR